MNNDDLVAVTVRRIRPDEGEALRRVRLAALSDSPEAFGSTYSREMLLTGDEWADRARRSASGSERALFFALDRESIVGLAGGYRPDGTAADVELISMWTDPSARRSGVGRRLVDAVIEWSRSVGAERVDLWVTKGNDPAEALYRAMGFVETGDYQPLPSDPCRDELRMSLAV